MAAIITKRPLKYFQFKTLLGCKEAIASRPQYIVASNFSHCTKPFGANENLYHGCSKVDNSPRLTYPKPSTLFGQQTARWMSVRSSSSGEIDFKLMDHHENKFRFMFRPLKFAASVSKVMNIIGNKPAMMNFMNDFITGSRQAIKHISALLAAGDFTELKQFVNPENLEKVKKNYYRLPMGNRKLLSVGNADLLNLFVYEMRVAYIPEEKKHRVEADVVASYAHEEGAYTSLFRNPLLKYFDERSAIICNYTFVRNFSIHSQADSEPWVVDKLNHFKVLALLYEMDKGDIPPPPRKD